MQPAQAQWPQQAQEPHRGRPWPSFHPFPSNGTRDPSERYRLPGASDLEVPGGFSARQPAPWLEGGGRRGRRHRLGPEPRAPRIAFPAEGENEAPSLEGQMRSPREGPRPGSRPQGESAPRPPSLSEATCWGRRKGLPGGCSWPGSVSGVGTSQPGPSGPTQNVPAQLSSAEYLPPNAPNRRQTNRRSSWLVSLVSLGPLSDRV